MTLIFTQNAGTWALCFGNHCCITWIRWCLDFLAFPLTPSSLHSAVRGATLPELSHPWQDWRTFPHDCSGLTGLGTKATVLRCPCHWWREPLSSGKGGSTRCVQECPPLPCAHSLWEYTAEHIPGGGMAALWWSRCCRGVLRVGNLPLVICVSMDSAFLCLL